MVNSNSSTARNAKISFQAAKLGHAPEWVPFLPNVNAAHRRDRVWPHTPQERAAAELHERRRSDPAATLMAEVRESTARIHQQLSEIRATQAQTARMLQTPAQRQAAAAAEVLGQRGGPRWTGDPIANTRQLVRLAERFGDESAEVRHYVATMRGMAKS